MNRLIVFLLLASSKQFDEVQASCLVQMEDKAKHLIEVPKISAFRGDTRAIGSEMDRKPKLMVVSKHLIFEKWIEKNIRDSMEATSADFNTVQKAWERFKIPGTFSQSEDSEHPQPPEYNQIAGVFKLEDVQFEDFEKLYNMVDAGIKRERKAKAQAFMKTHNLTSLETENCFHVLTKEKIGSVNKDVLEKVKDLLFEKWIDKWIEHSIQQDYTFDKFAETWSKFQSDLHYKFIKNVYKLEDVKFAQFRDFYNIVTTPERQKKAKFEKWIKEWIERSIKQNYLYTVREAWDRFQKPETWSASDAEYHQLPTEFELGDMDLARFKELYKMVKVKIANENSENCCSIQ